MLAALLASVSAGLEAAELCHPFVDRQLAPGDAFEDLLTLRGRRRGGRRLRLRFRFRLRLFQRRDDVFELAAHGWVGDAEGSFDVAEVAAAAHEEQQERLLIIGQPAEGVGRPPAAHDRRAGRTGQLLDLERGTAGWALLWCVVHDLLLTRPSLD